MASSYVDTTILNLPKYSRVRRTYIAGCVHVGKVKEAEVIVTDASVLNVLEMAKDVVGTNYLAERQTQREREREREKERERERGGGATLHFSDKLIRLYFFSASSPRGAEWWVNREMSVCLFLMLHGL